MSTLPVPDDDRASRMPNGRPPQGGKVQYPLVSARRVEGLRRRALPSHNGGRYSGALRTTGQPIRWDFRQGADYGRSQAGFVGLVGALTDNEFLVGEFKCYARELVNFWTSSRGD
jgi:hypothetical protein